MFRFENLDIWKRAIEMTDKLFDLADELEEMRRYRFAEQLRAAALSIPNNIAEGSGSRSGSEFKQFLNYSHRSVFETSNMLIICSRRRYMSHERSTAYINELEEVSRMLIGFSRSL